MYWVLQDGFQEERGWDDLVGTLKRYNLYFSIHKVIPFVGELVPDVAPPNPVICIGSYSMRHLALRRDWQPGVIDLYDITYEEMQKRWGHELLNQDAITVLFKDVTPQAADFFLKPANDSKVFAGAVFDPESFREWQHKVVDLEEDDGSSLRGNTPVIIARPKRILREYRLWIVDGKVVTASLYKVGSRVLYDNNVEPYVTKYGNDCARLWSPAAAYVMDIGMIGGEYGVMEPKIIEINTINSSGFYAANVAKIVEALEEQYK